MKVRLMEGEENVKQSGFRWTPQSATYGPVLFVSAENIICLALQRCKRSSFIIRSLGSHGRGCYLQRPLLN
jgi:hypothetical protein